MFSQSWELLLTTHGCLCSADSKVHSVKLQAEFEAPLWHVMALMVEFDLTKTWNAFMQVDCFQLSQCDLPHHNHLMLCSRCGNSSPEGRGVYCASALSLPQSDLCLPLVQYIRTLCNVDGILKGFV